MRTVLCSFGTWCWIHIKVVILLRPLYVTYIRIRHSFRDGAGGEKVIPEQQLLLLCGDDAFCKITIMQPARPRKEKIVQKHLTRMASGMKAKLYARTVACRP